MAPVRARRHGLAGPGGAADEGVIGVGRRGEDALRGPEAQATYFRVASTTDAPLTATVPLDGSVDCFQPEIAAIE